LMKPIWRVAADMLVILAFVCLGVWPG